MTIGNLRQLGLSFQRQLGQSQLNSCQLLKQLSCCQHLVQTQRNLNANRAAVTRVKRATYMRQYPTTLVQPDGSTITVRYPEPRIVLSLPLDIETATEEQKRKISLLRRPKQTLKVEEDSGDAFDPMKYIKK